VQLEFEVQSTADRGLSDVGGRTKQQDEGNYMWSCITYSTSNIKKVEWRVVYVCHSTYIKKTLCTVDSSSVRTFEIPS